MTIFTMGHSTLPIETFLRILAANSARMLVDVRTIPRSRHNPQFERHSLEESLTRAGIGYQWMPALGGLRPARKDSINLGWRNSSFRGYADYMQTPEFTAALEDLILTGAGRQTCIQCAEAVPWRCHRSLIADALTARELPVEHILYDAKGNSKRNPHVLTSFAKVHGTRVWYPPEEPLFAQSSEPAG